MRREPRVQVKGDDRTGELRAELELLRVQVDESARQFTLVVQARIDEILHALSRGGAPDGGHVLPEPRLVEKLVRRLKAHSRRPSRGRPKDLKRIHDLVALLSEALASRQ